MDPHIHSKISNTGSNSRLFDPLRRTKLLTDHLQHSDVFQTIYFQPDPMLHIRMPKQSGCHSLPNEDATFHTIGAAPTACICRKNISRNETVNYYGLHAKNMSALVAIPTDQSKCPVVYSFPRSPFKLCRSSQGHVQQDLLKYRTLHLESDWQIRELTRELHQSSTLHLYRNPLTSYASTWITTPSKYTQFYRMDPLTGHAELTEDRQQKINTPLFRAPHVCYSTQVCFFLVRIYVKLLYIFMTRHISRHVRPHWKIRQHLSIEILKDHTRVISC